MNHIAATIEKLTSVFRPKPDRSHKERRYYAATKAENKAARARAIGRRMELEIMSVHMTDEQREAAKARAVRRAS